MAEVIPFDADRRARPSDPRGEFIRARQDMLRAFLQWGAQGATCAELADEAEATATALRTLAATARDAP